MLVYLSGPMTGYPNNNAEAFDAAQAWLEDHRHVVVSPVDVERRAGRDMSVEATDTEYEGFMARDLDLIAHLPAFAAALKTTPGVVMLDGWADSGGAGREGLRAIEAGVPLYRLWAGFDAEMWLSEMPKATFVALHTTRRSTHHHSTEGVA